MKSATLLITVCAALSFACSTSKPATDAGPAQKAGAAVDQGAHDSKESAKHAADKLGDASEKVGDKMRATNGD